MPQPSVFISYNHKDEKEKDVLLSHLGVLQHTGLIDLWSDDRIGAGDNWAQEIGQAVAKARVAILLISANFLTSDFILRQEVPQLLERRQSEGLAIFPVIAKACAWKKVAWLTRMDVRPKNGRPVWGDEGYHVDEDLTVIAEEVADIIEKASSVVDIELKQAISQPTSQNVQPVSTRNSESATLPSQAEEFSPFIAGPPIPHPGRFFGREYQLKRLFALWQHNPLQNAAIIGPRRSGKTSLLKYLASITVTPPEQLRPGQRNNWLSQAERYRWIYVNFQNPRVGTAQGLLHYLLDGLDLQSAYPCELERFVQVVEMNLQTPTVILLDEIDVALHRYTEELDDRFWEGLRALAGEVDGNLGFTLASANPPEQLARESSLGSPFFNIFGFRTKLGPLTEPEARELIANSPIPFTGDDIDWILTQSGRWPILLQILCRERLVTLEEGETGPTWRDEGLNQIAPFQHLLTTNG